MSNKKSRSYGSFVAVLAILLSVFIALPIQAFAANGDAYIDVGDLGATSTDNSSEAATESQWVYNGADKIINLLTDEGNYTLSGTNQDLFVWAITTALNVNVTFAGVDINAASYNDAFGIATSCVAIVDLVGHNTLSTTSFGPVIELQSSSICTFTGSGSLTATGLTSFSAINNSATLNITGSASVTAVGGTGSVAVTQGSNINIGDEASFTITNNNGSAETHTFTKTGSAATVWRLSGDATLAGGSISDTVITVDIPAAGGTGTVSRVPAVCQIAETGVRYATLDYALAAAASGQTIELLLDIIEPATGTDLVINKDITIDSQGFDLKLNRGLVVNQNLAYVGGGDLEIAQITVNGPDGDLDVTADSITLTTDELLVIGNGATVSITGDLIALEKDAVNAILGAQVTIEGDITAPNTIFGWGIYAYDADTSVTVTGDIIAGGGVLANRGAEVKIYGNIIVSHGMGIQAVFGSTVTLTGNLISTVPDTVGIECRGLDYNSPDIARTEVFVGGDVIVDGVLSYGVSAESNGQVTIDGTLDAGSGTGIMIHDAPGVKDLTSLKSGYDQYSNGSTSPLAAITAVWLKTQPAPTAPGITGPTSMRLPVGYKSTYTDAFTITGNPLPTISGGNTPGSKISFDPMNHVIYIAEGLPEGVYTLTLTASNGVEPDAVIVFTLEVYSTPPTGDAGGLLFEAAALASLMLGFCLLLIRRRRRRSILV